MPKMETQVTNLNEIKRKSLLAPANDTALRVSVVHPGAGPTLNFFETGASYAARRDPPCHVLPSRDAQG